VINIVEIINRVKNDTESVIKIIILIFTIGVLWGWLKLSISTMEVRLTKIEPQVADLKENNAVINTKIDNIEKIVGRIERKIDRDRGD